MIKLINGQQLEVLPFEMWTIEMFEYLDLINDGQEAFSLSEALALFESRLTFVREDNSLVNGDPCVRLLVDAEHSIGIMTCINTVYLLPNMVTVNGVTLAKQNRDKRN